MSTSPRLRPVEVELLDLDRLARLVDDCGPGLHRLSFGTGILLLLLRAARSFNPSPGLRGRGKLASAALVADLALDPGQHRGHAAQPQRADQVLQSELAGELSGRGQDLVGVQPVQARRAGSWRSRGSSAPRAGRRRTGGRLASGSTSTARKIGDWHSGTGSSRSWLLGVAVRAGRAALRRTPAAAAAAPCPPWR